jgi:ABC-type nitrate/sulfonate/bicarbonate transport system substrate-binding protein
MGRMTIERRKVLALLGAAGSAVTLSRRASAASPLNFGYDEDSAWGVIGMVAKAQDLFKKAGADVNYYTFVSGKATRDAMLSGHIDLGILGSTPFILGAAKGEVIAIAMAMYAGKTDAVVVGAKSGITSMQDLKGRRVASELGTSTDYVFQAELLPKYGLSPSDLRIINTQGPNMIAALVSGSVDAIVDTEPFVSIAQADNIGKVIADYASVDMLPVVLGANRSVVEKRPHEVVAFLRGWLDTIKMFETSTPEVGRIIQATMQKQGFALSDKMVDLMLPKLGVNAQFVPGFKAYMEAQSKVLVQQHKLSELPDWDKLIDTSLLSQAMAA